MYSKFRQNRFKREKEIAKEIWGFFLTVLGWIFITCSLAMEGWKVAAIGGQGGSSVIYITQYWSSLWRTCSTASNAVSNCYDFPMLWSVENHVQIVRALLIGGISIGMLGFILSLVGMECTYIGGKEKEKNRAIFIGSLCHTTSGLLAAAGYAVYACHITAEFFNPSFELKFDLGTPLFIGWAGCMFQFTGGILYMVSIYKLWTLNRRTIEDMVPAEEAVALHSIPTNIFNSSELTTRSKESTVPELSLKSSSTVL
ncbi:claudin-10-like isoform X2 [Neoarius graeffei]|uniref:claudin-10-like isoform X2 n=1 Tax=Neoarius graeffei TaxID=443677 RepID=UPI00298C0E19|nr:claudin-10-like isoform X2 [Neoarius graeffei]